MIFINTQIPGHCDKSNKRCPWQVDQTGPSQILELLSRSPPVYEAGLFHDT